MKEKILITSALPYANGSIHFGHIAGAYLPADCYARFQRQQEVEVLYICGSDEYGVAITMSAELAGRTPQEHVDIFHAINSEQFKRLNISFDHYSRTTWKGHAAIVQEYFKDLLDNGYIEERTTDQLYSEADNKFLADRYVVGECPRCGFSNARGDECPSCAASYEATDLKNPRSKLTNSPLVHKPTKHWFLLLDKFKDKLTEWIEKKHWKTNVTNFAKGYIQEMHPRAITRDSNWGVPVPLPGTEGKVLYVWFDAPIGYISATVEWAQLQNKPDDWKLFWCDPDTKLVNFVGKDNIPFHAAIFPAMTIGQNQPFKLVDELPANEFYKLEGKQFSKSDGWFIDLADFLTRYSVDQLRYTIAANAPETSDSEFTWRDFQLRCNTDLAGKYGNLINRVMVFAKNNCEGRVPSIEFLEDVDQEFLDNARNLLTQARYNFETFKLRAAAQTIMEMSQLGNVYFDKKRPWQDAKQPETRKSMETTIACCFECLKMLAMISSPIIPDTAQAVWKMLGYASELSKTSWLTIVMNQIPRGQLLGEPVILFKRIEDEQMDQEIAKLNEASKSVQEAPSGIPADQKAEQKFEPLLPLIDIDDVRKLDLRVGVVLSAVPVPKSKKLLKLEVDLGFEKRTIVSGISLAYQPEQIVGKKVVVIANLKPAVLMGVQSQGMLLAGYDGTQLEVVSLQHLAPGSTVT